METTASKGSWDEDFNKDEKGSGENSKKTAFMTFPDKGEYTVRLVGSHVKFLRHWKPFKPADRVITHKSYKGEDPAWEAGFYPKTTFAIHIIDRADGKLKVLEKGTTIFKQFAKYKTVNDIDPAKGEGPDFVIEVDWEGNNKRTTKYSVTAKNKPAPFTKDEIAMIKADQVKLSELYKATSLDKIKELWEAIPEEDRIPPKKEEKDDKKEEKEEKQEDTVPEENVSETVDESGDDLFGDDETDF